MYEKRSSSYTDAMRGCVKAVPFLVLLLVLSSPAVAQCAWTPRDSAPFRTTALDVSVDGSFLWLATGYGVQLLDNAGTRIADEKPLPGNTRVVRADGRGLAYAGSGARLYILRRDGRSITIVRSIDTGGTVNDILLAGSFLFVATSTGLQHYDAFEPANPIRTTALLPSSSPNVLSLAATSSKLYAADGDDTVEVFTITIPSIPQHTGELKASARAVAVHATGDTVLLSDAFGVSTDVYSGTTKLGTLPVGANAFAAGSDSVHFVAGPDRTLRAVDFTSPTTLTERYEHSLAPTGGTDNVIHAIARTDNTLYVAAGDIGLAIFQTAHLARPYPIGSYRTSAKTTAVVLLDRAWFADASGTITEQRIVGSGISLATERTWTGGTHVHDAEGSMLLTSSGDTTTLWTLGTTPAISSQTKFRAAVKNAAIRSGDVVALLTDGSVWLGGSTPQQVTLPAMTELLRHENGYLFVEVRSDGKTVLHHFASADFAVAPRLFVIDGVVIGGAAFDGARAAVFTFSGVSVVDLASGAVHVATDSNRVIPRQLAFVGRSLLVLDTRTLYVYDDTRTLTYQHFLPSDAVSFDAQGALALIATNEGSMVVAYLNEQPTRELPFRNDFFTKVVAGGERLYLLGPAGIHIYTQDLAFIRDVKAGGIIDVAATADSFFTLSGGGVVTAYSRFGFQYAQFTMNEGSDAQPLAVDTAGNAVWFSLSRGCLTGGCQKKTLVLDPQSLAVTSTLTGGVIDVVTSGTRAYALFDLPSEVRVLSIADPLRPAQLISAVVPASAAATSIAAHPGRVYVIGDKLYQYAESTLLQTATHFTSVTPDKNQQIRVDGDCLIVTARGANPETYHAATLAPVAGSFEVPSTVRSLAVTPGRAFLLTGHSLEVWSSIAPVPKKRRAVR